MTQVQRPETEFAWNGDVALAYQVVGEGPIDLVYLQGFCSNIDLHWESPYLARFLGGLAGLGRLIVMDRRGWGCSDRFSPTDVPPLETLTDDLLVVLDAARSKRAVIVSSFETVSLVLMFAAAHPERCAGLVLIDPWITWIATDETPWAPSIEEWEESLARLRAHYGKAEWTSMKAGPERDWWLRYLRGSITPGSVVAEFRAYQRTDVRSILPSIQVPTLVLSSTAGGSEDSPENGRYMERRIPGARNVELTPPADELFWPHWYGRAPAILREVGAFVAGIRDEQASFDRVLAAVLFTDIVDSSATAAALGDAGWRQLRERHDVAIRALLARYRGVEVDTAGDGFFATFDGPARAVRCAMAIVEAMRPLGIEVRAGVHTGEIETIAGKTGGMAVIIGARVAALGGPSQVLASQTVRDLTVGSGLVFEDVGEHDLKGVPDRWRLYRVTSG